MRNSPFGIFGSFHRDGIGFSLLTVPRMQRRFDCALRFWLLLLLERHLSSLGSDTKLRFIIRHTESHDVTSNIANMKASRNRKRSTAQAIRVNLVKRGICHFMCC